MKAFITSLFLFFTISLFAQPQKGDIYVGFSNIRLSHSEAQPDISFRSRSTSLFIGPSFGKFIANNTLVGGGFSYTNFLGFSSFFNSSFLRFGLFSTQYFGKGKLKGLGQVNLNGNLLNNEGSRRSISGSFSVGGAYFVNEFTSLQLTYNIDVFSTLEGSKTEYFTSGIDPNIGLSVRTILLRNREGIENLAALNSIKKGTTLMSTSGGLLSNSIRNSRSISGSFSHFFMNNFYAGMGFWGSKSKNLVDEFSFLNQNVSLHSGVYFRIAEKLYTRFSTELSGERSINSSRFNFVIGEPNLTTSILRTNSEVGLALFLGRHKVETGGGFRFSSTQIKEVNLERMRDISTNFFIRHEWFLAENFAFTSDFNMRFNDVFYFVVFEGLSLDVVISESSRNNTNLGIGFKWYLSTPSE